MIVNFRIREISRDERKLSRILTLKKKYNEKMQVMTMIIHCVLALMYTFSVQCDGFKK
jgi:hypothetical protein